MSTPESLYVYIFTKAVVLGPSACSLGVSAGGADFTQNTAHPVGVPGTAHTRGLAIRTVHVQTAVIWESKHIADLT